MAQSSWSAPTVSRWGENDGRVWLCLSDGEGLVLIGGAVLLFLIAPILVIIPLSFNSVPFFSYPMPGLSLRWYDEFFLTARWQSALYNSIFIAVAVTLLSTVLGTLAALGLSRPNFPLRAAVVSL